MTDRRKKAWSGALGLLLTVALFSSCVEKPQQEVESEWQGKEDFWVSDEGDDALAARYEEYKENAGLAFTKNQPADSSAFTTETYEDGVKILTYTGSDNIVVIPERIDGKTVLALGENSFTGTNVRAVSVPDCVILIEKGAFASCGSLATMRLPFVGDGGENTHFGYIFGADSYEYHAVKVPASLDMVIIGEKQTEIAENAFAGCKSVSAVILPESIGSIGSFAFYECGDLVYVELGDSVKQFGNYAFGYCSSLFLIDFTAAERIGLGALYQCNALRELQLSFIGGSEEENSYLGYLFGAESADYNDEYVPESLRKIILSGCEKIPDRAFAGCTYISEFILEEGIESVGVRAFYGCRSLTGIDLPNSLKTLGDDAFFGCDNLEQVFFGLGTESIGMQAFYGCRSLKRIEIPDRVTEIAPSTFALCEALEHVELNQVKFVGKDAFWGCSSLKRVDCDGIDVAEGNECLVATHDGEAGD